MSLFREYATSIAFRVDLTKSMAVTLHTIDLYERSHARGNGDSAHFFEVKLLTGSVTDAFTTASRALLRRGLVEWRDFPRNLKTGKADTNAQTWHMTEAGRHVLALCRLAEIVPLLAETKPLKRRAA